MRCRSLWLVALAACSRSSLDPGGAPPTDSSPTGTTSSTASTTSSGSGGGGGGWVGPCEPTPTSGKLLWARRDGGAGWDAAVGLAVGTDGAITLTGNFDAAATFGGGTPGAKTLVPYGPMDILVVRYGPDGALGWATHAGGPSFGEPRTSGLGVAVAPNGDAFVAGELTGAVTFGAGEPSAATIGPSEAIDAFLAHFRSDGSFGWARRDGGALDDQARAVVLGPDGSPFVAGRFMASATFGEGEPNATQLVQGADDDGCYAARYTSHGAFTWAVAGGAVEYGGAPVALAPDGGVFVAGAFGHTVTFGAGGPNETTFTYDLPFWSGFLARYGANGDLLWARRMSGSDNVVIMALGSLSGGDVVAVGAFGGNATFGTGDPTETELASAGSDDLFVARFRADGQLAWAVRGGSEGVEEATSVAVSADDGIFVVGTYDFTSAISLGSTDPCATILPRAGDQDVFVARYAPSGSLVWARELASDPLANINVPRVAVSPDGTLLVSASFGGTAILAPGAPEQTSLISQGQLDILLAKYGQ